MSFVVISLKFMLPALWKLKSECFDKLTSKLKETEPTAYLDLVRKNNHSTLLLERTEESKRF
jgi:hypothetical protein